MSRRPKRRTETQIDFYNRIDDPAIGKIRELIETWFAGYAATDLDEANKLRQRLRSGRDDDFTAAVWELYLHETFLRLGCDVTIEPPVEGGEIDFLIENDSIRIYVEATALLRTAVSGGELPRGYAAAMDAVDDAFHPDFGLMVRDFIPGPGNPPLRELTLAAERLMSQYWWAERRKRLEREGAVDMAPDRLEAAGWAVEVVVWPRAAAERGCREYSTVLTELPLGGMSFAREAILKKLRTKAGKYKNLDAPFVIALNSFAMVGDDDDVLEALYGSEVYTFDPEKPDTGELARKPDGLWQRGSQTAFTRVAGVLAATQLTLHLVGRQWPRLWLNPWAADPIDAERLPWPIGTGNLVENRIEQVESAVDPGTFFELPQGWPGEPFAARHRRRAQRQCS